MLSNIAAGAFPGFGSGTARSPPRRREAATYGGRRSSPAKAARGRAVEYRRRSLDETDQKIIDHVREYGFVTNRTIQRLFDIHLFAARDILNSLRERELLDKIGEARGGKGVRYGPGPKFPR
ncbi:hypothetical protein [Planomonospora sp. ID82291]|uniref:hypothetical protein n=1 Tax=Planomonospora sp. ID82291 TaxID=2738136 RepID=UPI0018C39D73|nr:hypothetical protein [Planomonospora sp. ID82291]MBG0814798.1 hypothetical protein [Planomonospora sp. ID82291]